MSPENNARTSESSGPPVFARYSVVCPMCSFSSFQVRLNPRRCWNQDLAIDLQPRNFRCLSGLEGYHPPLYDVWFCPACQFAADHRQFSNPLEGMFIRADMVSGHIRELRQRNPGFRTVIEALGTDTDLGIQDFFRSIRLHLLSLFYVELIEALVKQNIVDMGRASLRVGWIYRDLAERPDQASAVQPLLKNLAHTIHPHWPTAPFDEPSALRQASSRYMQSIEKSRLITDASDRVQLLQIVGRIHLRIKEYEKAAENLRAALASAREARSRLDQELKAKDSDDTADQRAQKVSEVRRLTTLIDEADRLVELAQEERLKNDTVKAKALLAQVRSRSPEQQRAFLRENGITPRVISALLPEEKRGMFG